MSRYPDWENEYKEKGTTIKKVRTVVGVQNRDTAFPLGVFFSCRI